MSAPTPRTLVSRETAVRAWALALAYMATIFALSSIPKVPRRVLLFPHMDKVLHAVEYAGLAVLYARALRETYGAAARRRWLPAAALLAAFYGATDEYHQSFVPGRDANAADLAADAAGAALAAALYPAVERRRPRWVA